MTREELAQRTRSLAKLSEYSVRAAYQKAYDQCQLSGDRLPRARAIQELAATGGSCGSGAGGDKMEPRAEMDQPANRCPTVGCKGELFPWTTDKVELLRLADAGNLVLTCFYCDSVQLPRERQIQFAQEWIPSSA